ncbi:MAG: cyclic pyranopterin monophosphate synthase MoaC [Candidatus Thorarchaeota archaeon]
MSEDPIRMVDVTSKPISSRKAEAIGEVILQPSTIKMIRDGTTKKGNVLAVSEIAGIQAAKKTADIIPLCHQIPLSSVQIIYKFQEDRVLATCEVSANYTTGVEMEALVGVTAALLSIWDMVKYLEKDSDGQYQVARLEGIRVTRKVKESL